MCVCWSTDAKLAGPHSADKLDAHHVGAARPNGSCVAGRVSRLLHPTGGGGGGAAAAAAKAMLNLQQLHRRRAIAVDRFSRVFFPFSFFVLNVVYWCVFLNSEESASVALLP